jgi:hypothetical protein
MRKKPRPSSQKYKMTANGDERYSRLLALVLWRTPRHLSLENSYPNIMSGWRIIMGCEINEGNSMPDET